MKTLTVLMPASALAADGSAEPKAGDVIDLQGKARISVMQDGKARLVIESLNGVEPEAVGSEEDSDADADAEGDEDAKMTKAAEDADAEAYL